MADRLMEIVTTVYLEGSWVSDERDADLPRCDVERLGRAVARAVAEDAARYLGERAETHGVDAWPDDLLRARYGLTEEVRDGE